MKNIIESVIVFGRVVNQIVNYKIDNIVNAYKITNEFISETLGNVILREDLTPMLREDGTYFLREQ